MRINQYKTMLDEDRKNVLVKEASSNYPAIQSLKCPQNIISMMEVVFNVSDLAEEHARLLAMNNACHLIGVFELSHGSVTMTIMGSREIFVRCCLCGASGFVLVHNHPCGTMTPSKEDQEVTEKIRNAGDLMGIKLLDHIIVGNYAYYSFKEEGKI